MLKPADHDPRGDALFFCESPNSRDVFRAGFDKHLPGLTRDQEIRSPPVRFGFALIGAVFFRIHENVFLAVQQEVRGFVEQG